MTRTCMLMVAALALPAGCDTPGQEPEPAPRFTEVTDSGIDMVMTSGTLPSTQILEVNGGGLALFDADGDDDLDLFVANGATLDAPTAGPGCRLYENRSRDGRIVFHDITSSSGIDLHRWAMGAAIIGLIKVQRCDFNHAETCMGGPGGSCGDAAGGAGQPGSGSEA